MYNTNIKPFNSNLCNLHEYTTTKNYRNEEIKLAHLSRLSSSRVN